MQGQIRCRFENAPENIRSLGMCLRSFQTASFSPRFIIVETDPQQGLIQEVHITPTTIQEMMSLAKFSVLAPNILISTSTAKTKIGLVLRRDDIDVPISGFPRQLGYEDERSRMFSFDVILMRFA